MISENDFEDHRRAKLIRYIKYWIVARPRQYEVRVGTPGLGYTLDPDDLATVALERLRERITHNALSERKMVRRNRALREGRAAA